MFDAPRVESGVVGSCILLMHGAALEKAVNRDERTAIRGELGAEHLMATMRFGFHHEQMNTVGTDAFPLARIGLQSHVFTQFLNSPFVAESSCVLF